MTSREQIVAAIRRVAAENGTVPGKQRFESETGVREHEWVKYWARWGDALVEAGFKPNDWGGAYPEEELLERLASFARELGRFPVVRDLRVKGNMDPSFPSAGPYRRFGGQAALAAKLREYASAKRYDDVVALCAALPSKSGAVTASNGGASQLSTGFVYLMKSGRHYKIGRTVSVGSRERQLAIKVPVPPSVVHRIETDDPVGVEAYWHKRFQDKRGEGEWFALSPDDVKVFKRWRKIV
jgi:Meiotically Up-regulated Gene 113 (MUG113) protein